MRFGLHWGSTLYVGAITTEGRFEVTALGDQVNEAARIEACASGGRALASRSWLNGCRRKTQERLVWMWTSCTTTPSASSARPLRRLAATPLSSLCARSRSSRRKCRMVPVNRGKHLPYLPCDVGSLALTKPITTPCRRAGRQMPPSRLGPGHQSPKSAGGIPLTAADRVLDLAFLASWKRLIEISGETANVGHPIQVSYGPRRFIDRHRLGEDS